MLNPLFSKLFGKKTPPPADASPDADVPPATSPPKRKPIPPEWKPAAVPILTPAPEEPSPETLCDIDPGRMNQQEIRARLAKLYRRHNAAASSLKPELRAEAEQMLNAIVCCREKYLAAAPGTKPGVDPAAGPE